MTEQVTAGHVDTYLRSLAGDWPYPNDTVDTFKAGGPNTIVTGMAVAWLPFTWALEKASTLDCSLFITHEPTFYDHWDSRNELFNLKIPRERRRLLERSGMAVLRCHDLWDRYPGLGITTAWGDHLGLDRLITSDEYSRVYAVEPTTAREFASQVAGRLISEGQPGVQLVGDGDTLIETVCIGTGAETPYLDLVAKFDPDLVVCSDDGMNYWRDGAFAVDGGPPIVVVHHGVSEEPGVARLAEQLRSGFPQVKVHHIAQRCMYELIPPPTAEHEQNDKDRSDNPIS